MASKTNSPNWSDIKMRLAESDRSTLIGLVHELYRASTDNRLFLHSRFTLNGDSHRPCKMMLDRQLFPDGLKGQDYSVAKAKKSFFDYKKAVSSAKVSP
jgi:hypothetical protein